MLCPASAALRHGVETTLAVQAMSSLHGPLKHTHSGCMSLVLELQCPWRQRQLVVGMMASAKFSSTRDNAHMRSGLAFC